MESVLGRGSNGQAIDLVVVTNAGTVDANTGKEVVNVNQGYDFTSDGGNIEGVVNMGTNSFGDVKALAGTEVNDCTSTTTTAVVADGIIVAADDFKGQTLRLFKAAGATLNESPPLSGEASPHGPKGYDDVEITGSDESIETFSFAATGQAANYYDRCAVLPGVELSNTTGADIEKGGLKAIALVARER